MSIGFYLERTQPTTVFHDNQTHNVSPMWTLAGIHDDIYESEGKQANEIIDNLRRGLADMNARPEEYQKLNPENGWGSYETALAFLEEIIKACEEYPDATIRISA